MHDSKREVRRHAELLLLEKAGKISELRYHKDKLVLIPAQRGPDGKVIYRAVTYTPDFVYIENGAKIYEDVKGCKTREYILKKKLLRFYCGIELRET